MQNCTVVGNIVRINRIENTNKVFLTVADHYNGKNADGSYSQKTNFVPLEGFLPEGLKLTTGQLVGVAFRVTSYTTKPDAAGKVQYKTANDIVSIDVTLNSKKSEKPAADAAAAETAGQPVPEPMGAPMPQ